MRRLDTKAELVCISHLDLIMKQALKYLVLPRVVMFDSYQSKNMCLKSGHKHKDCFLITCILISKVACKTKVIVRIVP